MSYHYWVYDSEMTQTKWPGPNGKTCVCMCALDEEYFSKFLGILSEKNIPVYLVLYY